jgi:cellulose synthase/poly-beta-1,6-N-acetylglucosamine synthase-like glycosyltransferase
MSVIWLINCVTEWLCLSLCSEEVLVKNLGSEVVCPMWEIFWNSSFPRVVCIDNNPTRGAMSCFQIYSDVLFTVILRTEAVEFRLYERREWIQEDGLSIFHHFVHWSVVSWREEISGNHFAGGWVCTRPGLDGCGKFLLRQDSIPGSSSL